MNPVISVIVPVYNTEKYLDECIQSILNQSFTNFELLLIDDGSTDRSGAICDQYAAKDERVRVFHKENGGVTSARKLGVEKSESELICFVDSDDTIIVNALGILVNKMTDGIDVVISDTRLEEVITGTDCLNRLLKCELPVCLWGKLYRKMLFKQPGVMNIRREIYMGEDYLANMQMAFYVNYVYCLPKQIYQYRNVLSSVSHTRNYSLEYEELFRKEVENLVKNKWLVEIDDISWYKFQLRILMGLIVNKVDFSYDISWIRTLVNKQFNHKELSRKEWIIVQIHNAVLCRIIFKIVNKVMIWYHEMR